MFNICILTGIVITVPTLSYFQEKLRLLTSKWILCWVSFEGGKSQYHA